MSASIPLGSAEGQRLEFKGSEALAKPARLAREVVAFLNAGGGTLWIGIREDNSIAVEVEPLSDAESAKRRLLNALLDKIEPPLVAGDVCISVESNPDRQEVLRVEIKARRPAIYHVRGAGRGRHFYERVDERIRHLTWGEIADRVRAATEESSTALKDARKEIVRERDEFLGRARSAMWLRIKPVDRQVIDLRADETRRLLTDPTASGNRRGGWNPIDPYSQPAHRQGRLVQNGVSIHADGSLTLEVGLAAIHWRGDDHDLYPYALLEYPVSVFRIAAALYRTFTTHGDEGRFVSELAFAGLNGWYLRPYSPRSSGYRHLPPARLQGDFTLGDPLVFELEAIVERPDACARPLLSEFYDFAGFEGLSADADPVPFEFDAETGTLEIDG